MGGWPTFDGYITEQCQEGMDRLRAMLEGEPDVLRIVEIGTGHGGTSLFLASCIQGRGGKVLTIDRDRLMDNGYAGWSAAAAARDVSFLWGDAFDAHTVDKVREFIREHRAMIFCDDGNKPREVNLYAHILKPGDLLYAHDYGGEIKDTDIAPETAALLEDHRQSQFPRHTTIMSRIRL